MAYVLKNKGFNSTSMTSVTDWIALNNRILFVIIISAHAWQLFSPFLWRHAGIHLRRDLLLHDL